MTNSEQIELDIPLWDGWRIFAAELNSRGWAKVSIRKGDRTCAGRLRPDPPRLELPEELGEYDRETELTLVRDIIRDISDAIEALQTACLAIMHENIDLLLQDAERDHNPALLRHIENVLETLYEEHPEILARMALSEDYATSVRAVPARLFGKLVRMELAQEAALLSLLVSHPEKAIREATLEGISSENDPV